MLRPAERRTWYATSNVASSTHTGSRQPVQRHLADPLPISGNVRDAVADQANESLVIEPTVRWSKNGNSTNIAGRRGVLGKPQRAVSTRRVHPQTIHLTPSLWVSKYQQVLHARSRNGGSTINQLGRSESMTVSPGRSKYLPSSSARHDRMQLPCGWSLGPEPGWS